MEAGYPNWYLTYYVLEVLIAFFGTLLIQVLWLIARNLNQIQTNVQRTNLYLEPVARVSDEALKRMRLDVKA